jgi:hypothetical protein
MTPFRISFTIASNWAKGNYKQAVASYLKLQTYTSEAMENGKKQHELIKIYVEKHGKLPEFFDNTPLIKPVCEKKQEVMINDWVQLVFIPDCWNVKTILEYKFTKDTDGISKYVNSNQVELYALGMSKMGIEITRGEYLAADLIRKESSRAIIWISETTLKNTEEWLLEQAASFKHYLLENNLLK